MSEKCHNRTLDRKSTRLNSSHANISYAVFCLKKKELVAREDGHLDAPCHHSLTRTHVCALGQETRSPPSPRQPRAPSRCSAFFFFFFNDPATPEIYPLSLHDALPIWGAWRAACRPCAHLGLAGGPASATSS